MTMRKEYDFRAGRRGAITRPPPGKTRITIRLDDDLLDWFRRQVDDVGGGNYQTLINDALRTFIATQDQPLEQILRKVLREELHRAGSDRKSKPRKAA
jgi:BrnA antitoxin of type II toxin-antitoxin system